MNPCVGYHPEYVYRSLFVVVVPADSPAPLVDGVEPLLKRQCLLNSPSETRQVRYQKLFLVERDIHSARMTAEHYVFV